MDARGMVIVTCGPAFAPIDAVRRLTNHSTGELGLRLAHRLEQDGWKVVCFVGEGATSQVAPSAGVDRRPFGTNDDLQQQLQVLAQGGEFHAVFHAAALCDFRVAGVTGAEGHPLTDPKLSSRKGAVTLHLEPAPKLLPTFRALFPKAKLVGWKYEAAGPPHEVIEKGRQQLTECRSDLCIVNGPGYAAGFGIVAPGQSPIDLPDKPALCEWLAGWLER